MEEIKTEKVKGKWCKVVQGHDKIRSAELSMERAMGDSRRVKRKLL